MKAWHNHLNIGDTVTNWVDAVFRRKMKNPAQNKIFLSKRCVLILRQFGQPLLGGLKIIVNIKYMD